MKILACLQISNADQQENWILWVQIRKNRWRKWIVILCVVRKEIRDSMEFKVFKKLVYFDFNTYSDMEILFAKLYILISNKTINIFKDI